MSDQNLHNKPIEEGIIKVDLRRLMTKIMGAIEFKTNPKMRQELLAAIKDDVESILKKYDYATFESEVTETETGSSKIKTFGEYIEEMSTPANTPGMGSVLFPGNPGLSGNFSSQAHGSGDIPLEIYKKKKKKKAKK